MKRGGGVHGNIPPGRDSLFWTLMFFNNEWPLPGLVLSVNMWTESTVSGITFSEPLQ